MVRFLGSGYPSVASRPIMEAVWSRRPRGQRPHDRTDAECRTFGAGLRNRDDYQGARCFGSVATVLDQLVARPRSREGVLPRPALCQLAPSAWFEAVRTHRSLFDRHAITDHHESPDITLTIDKKDPMENTDPADPIPPTESTDPIDPTDKTELREPMDRTESRDHSDHREPRDRRFSEPFSILSMLGPECLRSPNGGLGSPHRNRGQDDAGCSAPQRLRESHGRLVGTIATGLCASEPLRSMESSVLTCIARGRAAMAWCGGRRRTRAHVESHVRRRRRLPSGDRPGCAHAPEGLRPEGLRGWC